MSLSESKIQSLVKSSSLSKREQDERALAVAAELKVLRQDALELYRPYGLQEDFHRSLASERIIRGGNRCLGGEQRIYDPVTRKSLRVDEIQGDFHVHSRNPKTGKIEVKAASKPFIKSWGPLYRVTLSNGQELVTTLEHRILTSAGVWASVEEAWKGNISLCADSQYCAAEDVRTGFRESRQFLSQDPERTGTGVVRGVRRQMATGTLRDGSLCAVQRQVYEADLALASQSIRTSSQSLSRCGFGKALGTHRPAETLAFSCQSPPESGAFRPLSISDTCLSKYRRDVRRSSRTAQDCLGGCSRGCHLCGEPLRSQAGIYQVSAPSRVGVRGRSQCASTLPGGAVHGAEYSHACQSSALLSSPDVGVQASVHESARRSHASAATSGSSVRRTQVGRRSLASSSFDRRTCTEEFLSSEQVEFASSHPLKFNICYHGCCCHIESIVFVRCGAVYDISVESYANYVAAGITNANSGKSTAAFSAVASAAMRKPIRDSKGSLIPNPFPTKRPLTIWLIGFGEAHIGATIYRMLFQPGAFKIIKDLKTGQMRAWNPRDPEDMARQEECEQAPPLIPKRAIDPAGWGWKDKRKRIFTVCRLKNGTEIYAFTSNADPKQGDPVDLILIDEDIQFPGHVAEWQARLSDRKGRLIWAAFPHGENSALAEMSRRAEKQAHLENPDVAEWVLTFSGNPYMPADEIRKRREGWSEAEARARDLGQYVFDEVQMFPTFRPELHCTEVCEHAKDCKYTVDRILGMNGNQPPLDWTRYLILDPGHSHPAVLFAAIPPPALFPPNEPSDYIVLYDELYVRNIDAMTLAHCVLDKVTGQNFECFIIDGRAGRQTPMGFSHTIQDQYAMAFEHYKLQSNLTDNGFVRGSDDVCARNSLIRTMLLARPNGPPQIRVIKDRCPNLINEFRDYRKRLKSDETTDEQVDKDNHLLSGLGYLVSYNPQYVQPNPEKGMLSVAYRQFQLMQERRKGEENTNSVHMGPWQAA